MNRPIEQRVPGVGNALAEDRTVGKRKFFALMGFFVLSFCFLAYVGVHYNGEFGRLEGRVIDSATQEPISGVMVSIHGVIPKLDAGPETRNKMPFERAFYTKEDGRFAISTVKGRFAVVVECAGFKTQEVEIEMDRKQIRDMGSIALVRSTP